MQAVILVGGLGTRLRPLTFSIPKPLLPFREKPMLQHLFGQLQKSGIRDVILATGYQSEFIEAFCGDGSKFGLKVSYAKEEKPLGTAGPLALLKKRLDPQEPFLLMNGDILSHCDFWDFAEFHNRLGNDLTVGYAKYDYQSPFGVLEIEGEHLVSIQEKPSTTYAISAGIYFLRPSVIDLVPEGTFFTVPELARRLLDSKRKVGTYYVGDFWFGMEHITQFEEALKELKRIEEVTGRVTS